MNKWKDNSIQFPRLLAEIIATQELDIPALAESMDLTEHDVLHLFDRAEIEWQEIKDVSY
jgi:hypothetical protein